MEPSSGAASGLALQVATIGGVLVTRDDIVKALGALQGRPDTDTWILPRLLDIESPLARTAYRRLADRYQDQHPEDDLPKAEPGAHPARRRVAFIHLLEHELDALDHGSGSLTAGGGQAEEEGGTEPLPLDDVDERLRVQAEIFRRQGQARFRQDLMDAYSNRCVVTGCDATWALEAAHIRSYHGLASNDVRNGLLLRGDIHTLFDLHLLGIDPETRTVALSWRLSGKHYKHLAGVPLAAPKKDNQRPSKDRLVERWQRFQKTQETI
jgi:HNH endonuclease